MRFHCLMMLRDEGDIIAQSLAHLLSWADAIYILDLGSTDGTWDVVQDMAKKDSRVVPFKQMPVIFSDNLRGLIFDQFRDRFDNGDWVLRTDTDEFYHVPPPRFVQERLRALDTAVWLQWYYFKLLKREVADYESGRVDVLGDRERPVFDRRRYYKMSEYGEPRMFRYRRSMNWHTMASFPSMAGFVSRERIPIRHYPHRDPLQMEMRFRLRAKMMSMQAHAGAHWKLGDWRSELVDDEGVSESATEKKGGLAGEHGIDTGALHYWKPGTELVEVPLRNHLPGNLKRVAQRLIHPMLLPILDARTKGFDKKFEPVALPAGIQEALREGL